MTEPFESESDKLDYYIQMRELLTLPLGKKLLQVLEHEKQRIIEGVKDRALRINSPERAEKYLDELVSNNISISAYEQILYTVIGNVELYDSKIEKLKKNMVGR